MALILSLESSTSVCSVAIHHSGKLIASSAVYVPQSASAQLAEMVDQLFANSSLSKNELTAVAVSAGPGSYTGLRIAVALAKGLCFSLRVPLLSVNTLEVMSHQVQSLGCCGFLCPMIDARRMEVYCQLVDNHHLLVMETQAKVIDSLSFRHELEQHAIYFFGDGAAKCKTILQHPNAIFLDNVVPLASAMGELGFKKFQENKAENLVTFEPIYLKEFLVKKPNAKI
jgi:tRNA threonylcarbamoyladenosine biosynthesis protein TsaB